MKRLHGKTWLVAGAAAAALATGVGYAAIPSSSGAVNGCYEKITGILRVIDTEAGKKCKSFETPIAWSVQGPRGSIGLAGPTGMAGPAGAQGAQGPKGEQGEKGEAGPAGADGQQGPAGTQGAQGTQGPKGEDGAPGPAGASGETGTRGETGPAGPEGPSGSTGPTGAAGTQGPTGPQGPAGPSGTSATYSAGPGSPTQLKTTSLDTTVRRLDLPGGTYLVVASAQLESFTPSSFFDSGVRHVRCLLVVGSRVVARGVTLGPELGAGSAQTVAFDAVSTFAGAGAAVLSCSVPDILDNVRAFNATISAIKTG